MAVTFASNKLMEDVAMTSSFQSDEIYLHRKTNYSIHSIFTGSPVGSMYIAVSINGDDWIVLADSTQAIAAAGDIMYNIDKGSYSIARLHYTFASGSGTCNSFFDAKGEI